IYLPLDLDGSTHPGTDRGARPQPTSLPVVSTSSSVSTILLVDDEASLRRVTVRILKKAGYEVLEAAGGHEALELCAARATPVDLVITDVVMP
ncbi:MAG TPA: response regulator, partial [Myxococcota bacterium]|nr:response regulator [Myxococcota bacterium]